MSREESASGAPPEEQPAQNGEQQEDTAEAQERPRQKAWAARQALIQHGPSFVLPLARSSAATAVARDQFGVSGGTVHGDVNIFGALSDTADRLSGVVRPEEIAQLADVFCGGPSFDEALARLREDRVVVLSGGRDTGRRTAALMLLRRLTDGTVRSLTPPASLTALLGQLDDAGGYLLLNFRADRGAPLREVHLLGLRERLERSGGHLVITVEPSAALDDVPFVRWEPPATEDMLRAHVAPSVGEEAWAGLCGRDLVRDFLVRRHQPAAVEEFARQLVALHRGDTDEQALAAHRAEAVEAQVVRWLTDDERELRDKAFLVSLAVFDKAPYAVAAELADVLHARLQHTADPRQAPVVRIFGASREDRLRLVHADGYHDEEVTEWGPVHQFFAGFREERMVGALVEAVWNLHPSARPALVAWIRRLAEDGRPLVRTRAASATALLARADFSSAMAHLIEPWADDDYSGSWLTAANALTMAHLLGVEPVLRVLRAWCTGDVESRRWTAVRAYGLLGPVNHEETLDTLLEAVRRPSRRHGEPAEAEDDEPTEEARQFADALELLLLAVREPVLRALAERLDGDRADRTVRAYALAAFCQACEQREDPVDRPLVLHWYAQAVVDGETETARQLAGLWQALLADRVHGKRALRILRGWVFAADGDPAAESALAPLLSAVTTTPTDHRRVDHLLRTVRHADGTVPAVAERLRPHISHP
ncbi:hypothetical protein GTY75_15035 [Streptomyces sp. SID8381]|uniref:hypothetical protein n=1 Tax=unclassified Streptomyces TaxID=2593676 RepID=UPI00036A223F|nr:hypothetical protein [Streptomyces sp. Amel2xE9]MYX27948.1 hypothetical protein [Streptomyces sp. SID8381]